MNERNIMIAAGKTVIRYYDITPSLFMMKKKQGGWVKNKNVISARAAYAYLCKLYRLPLYQASKYISVNNGNLSRYRKQWEQEVSNGDKQVLKKLMLNEVKKLQ